jgi:regulator of replication initiation timing
MKKTTYEKVGVRKLNEHIDPESCIIDPDYRVSIKYKNISGADVYIRTRDNVITLIPQYKGGIKNIQLEDGYLYTYREYINTQKIVDTNGSDLCAAYNNGLYKYGFIYKLMYKFYNTEECRGKVMYCYETDSLYSVNYDLIREVHFPNDYLDYERDPILEKINAKDLNITLLDLLIVDNDSVSDIYYTVIQNRIVPIRTSKSRDAANYPPGVYHILYNEGNRDTKSYNLDECIYKSDGDYKKPILIFKTKIQAKDFLEDLKNNNDVSMNKMKMKLAREKSRIEELRNENDKLSIKNKEITERYGRKKLEMDDYYDTKRYIRKDNNDKIVSAGKVAGGLAALFAAGYGIYRKTR